MGDGRRKHRQHSRRHSCHTIGGLAHLPVFPFHRFKMPDTAALTHSIQLAIAPVFFLTAVAGMVGAVAGRLARIIDRSRVMDDRIQASHDPVVIERCMKELTVLRRRGKISNLSIGLLTLCGFLIGLTMVFLFLGQIWVNMRGELVAVICFVGGVCSFIAALGCFLWETVLATHLLHFDVLNDQPADTQRPRAGSQDA